MLSRIRIRGFKSFAEPTTLDLVPGVNVVVGPNGSGKSNVVEAVLWALGEQRPARLRAGSMGEVLFSGGEGKSQAAYADVELTLGAQEDGADPIEVSRRLTAAGDSAYRLAGINCRLLDVQEAFAARGLGPDSLTVVRQGQVEGVCAAAPAALRGMIDEAAGIAHGRRRRRRTEGRLNQIEDRLDQARAMQDDLVTRMRKLDRQARAADRAEALEAELADTRGKLERSRIDALFAAADTASREVEDRRTERSKAEEVAQAARTRAQEAQAVADEARRRAAEYMALERRVASAAERCEGRHEVAADRIATAESTRREAAAAAAAHDELRAAAESARADAEVAATGLEAAERAAMDAEERAASARAEAAQRREDAASSQAAISQARKVEETAAGRSQRVMESLARVREQLEVAGGGLSPADDSDRAARREEIASRRVAAWRGREAEAAGNHEDADARRRASAAQARSLRAQANALGERGGAESGVGAGLEVEPGLEEAVAAALGDLIDAQPVASLKDAAKALAAGARAAVVTGVPSGGDDEGLTHAIRDCRPESAPHLRHALGGAQLVERLEDAPADAEHGVFVTADGVVYRAHERLAVRIDGDWAAGARARRFAEQADAVEAEAADAERSANAAAGALEVIARRRRAAERSAARAAERLAAIRANSLARTEEAHGLEAHLARLERELQTIEAERAGVRGDLENVDELAREQAELADAAQEMASEAAAAARTAMDVREQARGEDAAARRALADAEEQAARAEAAARLVGHAPDFDRLRESLKVLAAAGGALRDCAERCREETQGLQAAAESNAREAAGLAESRDEAETALAACREAEAVAAERERATHEQVEGIARPTEVVDDADPDLLLGRVEELERARTRIGAVNALAQAERGELEAQAAELGEQIEDLEQASNGLRERVAGLDARVTEAFDATFTQLRENFSESVALLFPGGAGRLRELTDSDGEEGIEIEVVPAGKRPRPLRLLSGGERSLIALAFCLALAQTRPAPVYVLDEVDAALDDPNLRRFLALIEKLAGHTQFVLVTHQQPTVEAARAVYGVTMRAGGVSQLLSRRLPPAAEEQTAPLLRAVAGGRA